MEVSLKLTKKSIQLKVISLKDFRIYLKHFFIRFLVIGKNSKYNNFIAPHNELDACILSLILHNVYNN
jgi:hypothetical protein